MTDDNQRFRSRGSTNGWNNGRLAARTTTTITRHATLAAVSERNVNVSGILMPQGIRATAAVVMATALPGNDAISSSRWNLRGE